LNRNSAEGLTRCGMDSRVSGDKPVEGIGNTAPWS